MDGIADRNNTSLRESFDFKLYNNPIWKSVEKRKWRTKKGISYEG